MTGDASSPASSSPTDSSPASCTGCWRSASCSSTGPPESSTSRSGGMGLVGAGLLVLLTAQYGVPFWLAVLAALVVGTLYGALLEHHHHPPALRRAARHRAGGHDRHRATVARRFSSPTRTSTRRRPASRSRSASAHEFASIRITGAQLSILIVVPLVAVFLSWLLTHTTFGKTVKASAENRDLARLNGISPTTGVDVRVGGGRRAGDVVDRAHRRANGLGDRPREPRPEHARAARSRPR